MNSDATSLYPAPPIKDQDQAASPMTGMAIATLMSLALWLLMFAAWETFG
ncbi:hypothetical protein KZ810_03815 [Sphingomonas sp. RHCKR47]|nr:hypothetical protein [Sphingomonas citricola]MBW6522615.1 hypothetical protein [Sphingomonas citricola]